MARAHAMSAQEAGDLCRTTAVCFCDAFCASFRGFLGTDGPGSIRTELVLWWQHLLVLVIGVLMPGDLIGLGVPRRHARVVAEVF